MTKMKAHEHPFVTRPHGTLLGLMFPVLLALAADPLTGLVDTAFVARLGTDALAGLGVAAVALGAMFWIFNFLNVGTQTQVSQAYGGGATAGVRRVVSLALMTGWGLGLLVMVAFYPLAGILAGWLGAEGPVREAATVYLQIRLLSAPAVFTTLVGFGALRGAQDMRVPSVVAVAINAFNIVLDYPLIFGLGPIPAMGVAGAALASTLSQYIGAAWLLAIVVRRFGFERPSRFEEVRELFSIGGNLFLRTGLLTVFLLVATRVANRISPEAGAAHQVVRQVYIFTALVLDAFAVSTQSLVGYFVGAGQVGQARRAASLSIWWSLGSGVLLAAGMVLLTDATIRLMVPAAAVAVFGPAWIVSAIAQPLNALAFSTDGVHMGTGDYGYLRNGMFAATLVGVAWLLLIPVDAPGAFTQVWWATGAWVVVRAGFGLVRVYWHPAGRAPLTAAAAGD